MTMLSALDLYRRGQGGGGGGGSGGPQATAETPITGTQVSFTPKKGFTFLPLKAIIPPQVFHFCQPLLLFNLKFCTPRFSYSALGFSFSPS